MTMVLEPCEYEDSMNCYWNAQEQGNGVGTSFIDIDGTAYYPEAMVVPEVPEIEVPEPLQAPEAPIEISTGVAGYPEELAVTGLEPGVLPLIAIVLVATGIAMVLHKRRSKKNGN